MVSLHGLLRLQMLELDSGLSEEDLRTLNETATALSSLSIQKECYWRQHSRIGWLTYSDSNTSFFHKSASARNKVNSISALQLKDGSWTRMPSTLSLTGCGGQPGQSGDHWTCSRVPWFRRKIIST